MNRYSEYAALSELRAACAKATTATEVETIVRRLEPRYSPAIAAEFIGASWPALTNGRKTADRVLQRVLERAEKSVGDWGRALELVGIAMMSFEERCEFSRLMRQRDPRKPLCRVTDYTRFTGWYLSRPGAMAQWVHGRQPAFAAERVTVSNRQILAVKKVGKRFEIVLTPNSRLVDRQLLT